ncbi:MAG TPA: PKD domain-containing protein, partial [Candidatus Dormibacteraeota bacterium]
EIGRFDLAQVSLPSFVVLDMSHRFGRVRFSTPRGRLPRWTLAAGVAAGLLLAIPAQALATADAVDQAFPTNVVPSQVNSTKLMAQTFTASITGQIDKVSLSLESHLQPITGWVQIRTVAADGSPTGGTLQPAAIPIQFTYAFGGSTYHDYTISPAFPITAGTQYAIVWVAKVGTGFWWGSNFDAYVDRGQQWGACTGCGWTPFAARDLAFKTWVATTPTNQPPVASADHPAVAVNEGTPAGNTGTFSDPDGNPVALTASSGTVTKSGTSSGTWSWSAAAADEGAPANQTVTITADDGNGGTSTVTFPVTVAGALPIASITAPGSTAPEGTAVHLAGSAVSPSAIDNAFGFAYSWSVTKNGVAYKSGTGAHWQFTPDDEGTFLVSMRATDDGGMSDTAFVTVTGTNVWPTAVITSVSGTLPLVITPQETINFGGSYSDPGALDSHTSRWNFGDASSSSANHGPSGSGSLSASHAYGAPGTYHVSLTVTDDDGGAGVATTTVVVQTPQQALTSIEAYVRGIKTLNKGQISSLIAKLDAASASAARGDNNASHNQMSAFLNELRAYVKTGKVTGPEQTTLTRAIHGVEAALGTYNRMLQWWPLEP